MTLSILAILIGIVAGLRPMTALAAVAWGDWLGGVDLSETWLAFLGYGWSPWAFTAFALAEYVVEKMSSDADRSWPQRFLLRLACGAICGAAIGAEADLAIEGMGWGATGAAIGTLAGNWLRIRLTAAMAGEVPAGFVQDAIAIGGAAAMVAVL